MSPVNFGDGESMGYDNVASPVQVQKHLNIDDLMSGRALNGTKIDNFGCPPNSRMAGSGAGNRADAGGAHGACESRRW